MIDKKQILESKEYNKIMSLCKKQGQYLNEHVITNIISSVLSEAVEEETPLNYELTEKEIKDETRTLQQLVSSRIKVYGIVVTTEDGGNVILEGEILDFKIKFMFILNESEGVYIKAIDGTNLTEKTLSTLGKLLGYYENWKDNWIKQKLNNYV